MSLMFIRYQNEAEKLVSFLTAESWDHHGESHLTEDKIQEQLKEGFYTGHGTETFWVLSHDGDACGLLRIFDLEDGTPLFDLRLSASVRGKGYGKTCVEWLTDYIFLNYPDKNRIEAYTRVDNAAMRRVLAFCGYVKEAHHREAWPSNGILYDAAGYGVLRKDWESKTLTPVKWEE